MKQVRQSMATKVASVSLAMLTIVFFGPTIKMRSWREETGKLTRHMGLVYVEIEGCGPASGSTSLFGHMQSLACMGSPGTTITGVMTWRQYRADLCKRQSLVCSAGAVAEMVVGDAAGGWCMRFQERCDNLDRVIWVNIAVMCIIFVGACCCLSASTAVCLNKPKGKFVGLSGLGFFCVVSGVVAYWLFGDDSYAFGGRNRDMASSGPSFAFGLACGSATTSFMLFMYLAVMAEGANAQAENSDDEGEDSSDSDEEPEKKALLKKKKKGKQTAQHNDYDITRRDGHGPQAGQPQTPSAQDYQLQQIFALLRDKGVQDPSLAFECFDTNHDGYISTQEFSMGLNSLAAGLSQQQIDWLMQWMDKDQNGYVNYQEFATEVQRASADFHARGYP